MSRKAVWAMAAAALLAAVAGPVALASVDDLEVVKRAVGGPTVTASVRAQEAASAVPAAKEARTRLSKSELRWFKVRIVEKGSKRAKVTVNLPIALVRALGDDFPVDIGHCRGRYGRGRGDGREWGDGRECSIRISEVLDALEEGQDLVEIDDEDTTVRVWVE